MTINELQRLRQTSPRFVFTQRFPPDLTAEPYFWNVRPRLALATRRRHRCHARQN
jgi:hypothetical protein